MNIGIYGGTFDPIHKGHLAAALFAVESLHLECLYLIPTGIPPHKAVREDSADSTHRLEMTRLAAASLGLPEVIEVLDVELKRGGSSYTVDTLREIAAQHPEDTIYLLMGADMFLTFQYWKAPQEIAGLCTLCAFGRSRSDAEELLAVQRDYLKDRFGADIVTITLPDPVEISSTRLRQMLAQGQGREYLTDAVYGYILREQLYGTKKDLKNLSLDELRCVALTMLNPKRIPHVLGTEETAAALAVRWGADEEEARRGALLHDCTKRMSREEHLALCRRFGETDIGRLDTKLLHAITGAMVAREVFGVSPAIEQAIRWHTTGKADMTLLEKIIYLADYIEPNRSFCDLTELRRLSMEHLDKALLLGFSMAVEDLQQKGVVVDDRSREARDYLRQQLEQGEGSGKEI